MEHCHCETLEELKIVIKQYGRVLYRGQTKHYLSSDGSPSMPTSFQRQGCVPDLMIMWTYYAKRALQHLVRGWNDTGDNATNQAILQHYGFRSFSLMLVAIRVLLLGLHVINLILSMWSIW